MNEEERREKNRERIRKWRAANPDRKREINRESARRCRAATPEQYRNYSRKYYQHRQEDNPEWQRERIRQWRADNPDKDGETKARRRTQHYKAGIGDKEALRVFFKWARESRTINCWYCRVTTVARVNRHVDHIVPLAKGGAHSVENLAVSCNECNLKKNAKSLSEWLATPIPGSWLQFTRRAV